MNWKKSSISFIYSCILAFSQLPNTIRSKHSNLKPNTNHTIINTQMFFSILSFFIYFLANKLRPFSHRLALFLFLFLSLPLLDRSGNGGAWAWWGISISMGQGSGVGLNGGGSAQINWATRVGVETTKD